MSCVVDLLQFARQYSRNEQLTWQWLGRNIGWPLSAPQSIVDLVHLEAVFDVLDLYLWLSYRFPDLFPDADAVRGMQHQLDLLIQQGVLSITQLLRATMSRSPASPPGECSSLGLLLTQITFPKWSKSPIK